MKNLTDGRISKIVLALWFCLISAPVSAQDFSIDAHLIDRCLGRNDHTPMACVGRQAEVCFGTNNGGSSMILAACQWAEHEYWDGALNQAYRTGWKW